MIADGILDFKLALPRNKLLGGEFHDKFGVFYDSDDHRVSFNGSYNESEKGTRNYESIKIFRSWDDAFLPLVDDDTRRFERLWNNHDPNVQVYDLPDAVHARILKLRINDRPYPEPEWMSSQNPKLAKSTLISLVERIHVPPEIVLRDYQIAAIEAWFNADCKGIFEMATGTGKTITALSGIVRLVEREQSLIVVIICPYTHLVEQWADEALAFGFRPIHAVESKTKWQNELASELRNFRRGTSSVMMVIGTNSSLQRGLLDEVLSSYWSKTVFVADEVHYVGSPGIISRLPLEAPWQIGLSATPVRHYDSEGTEIIFEYFNNVVYEMSLEAAIGEFLTPYFYYPIPVEMTDDEFDEYVELTRYLQKLVHSPDEPMSEAAKKIAIKRARVINNSVAKLDWLENNIEMYSSMQHTLFYVGDKLFADVKKLLGVDKRVRIHEFTQNQNVGQRKEILSRFEKGNLQALVAMKCLDEGVDIPPTRTAYFLASSGNPREFVQRRGRVLRKSPGKENAVVYDLISIPPMNYIEMGQTNPDYSAVRSAIRREYRRVKDFARLAINQYQSLDSMFEILEQLDLLDT